MIAVWMLQAIVERLSQLDFVCLSDTAVDDVRMI